jgi:hypothetical protein
MKSGVIPASFSNTGQGSLSLITEVCHGFFFGNSTLCHAQYSKNEILCQKKKVHDGALLPGSRHPTYFPQKKSKELLAKIW